MSDYVFSDENIEGFTFDECNAKQKNIELQIKDRTEVIILSLNDLAYLAGFLMKPESLKQTVERLQDVKNSKMNQFLANKDRVNFNYDGGS